MTNKEAIEILEVAQAECEWIAPLEYQVAFDTAIYVLQNSVPYEVYKQVVQERDVAIEQLKELGYELGEKIRTDNSPTQMSGASDLISRQAAIDAILDVTGNSSVRELYEHVQEHGLSDMWSGGVNAAIDIIIAMPSAQPTLYGYDINHLALIAEILRREKMSPEKVMEALTDISKIVELVRDEFEESLKKAVQQCMT